MSGRSGAAAPLLFLLAALAATGCGRKGAPVAPEVRVPRAVADLRAVVREGGVELTWSVPRTRLDNTRLVGLGVARVFRVDDEGRGEPRRALLADDVIPGYTEIATIRLADPPSPFVSGGRVAYTDRRGLVVGRRYTYVVLTADTFGRTSPPSPRVSITFLAAPEPPPGLAVEAGERQARLTWQPSIRFTDGNAVAGPLVYEILRGDAPDAGSPIARTAPGVTAFTDRDLENDRTYWYAVRAIRAEEGTTAEGEPTRPVAAMPVDLTPPAPPRDFVAIPSRGAVRLSWAASPEPDVVAYVVYRAEAGRRLERLARVSAPATTFVDRDVARGTYRYAVTAQDGGSRANESAHSTEVTVTVP